MRQLVLSLHESNRKEETAKWATVLLELARKVSKKVLRESQIFISSNQIPEQKENKYPNEVSTIYTNSLRSIVYTVGSLKCEASLKAISAKFVK